MFQYNILGLLNSILERADKNSELGSMRDFQEEMDDGTRIEMIRLVLLCIAEMCSKAEHVRNFTVINHKEVAKCTKVYKA